MPFSLQLFYFRQREFLHLLHTGRICSFFSFLFLALSVILGVIGRWRAHSLGRILAGSRGVSTFFWAARTWRSRGLWALGRLVRGFLGASSRNQSYVPILSWGCPSPPNLSVWPPIYLFQAHQTRTQKTGSTDHKSNTNHYCCPAFATYQT